MARKKQNAVKIPRNPIAVAMSKRFAQTTTVMKDKRVGKGGSTNLQRDFMSESESLHMTDFDKNFLISLLQRAAVAAPDSRNDFESNESMCDFCLGTGDDDATIEHDDDCDILKGITILQQMK